MSSFCEPRLAGARPASTNELNLKSIQRIDPCAVSVTEKSVHGALYILKSRGEGWHKTEVEGPTFLYRRADHPYYSIMIANRQSLNDYIEPVTSELQLHLSSPYLMIKKKNGNVTGIWFTNREDCCRFFVLMDSIRSGCFPPCQSERRCSGDVEDMPPSTEPPGGQRENEAEPSREKNMPALLQELLCKESIEKLPEVPKSVALSSEQIEKEMLNENMEKENRRIDIKSVARQKRGHFGSWRDIRYQSCSASTGDATMPAPSNAPLTSRLQKTRSPSLLLRTPAEEGIAPLTKYQLYLALQHLMKDDDFLTSLHHAYIANLNSRLGLREGS